MTATSLAVAHSKDMKLEIFWSTKLTFGFLTARMQRTYYVRSTNNSWHQSTHN
jgi:hypothetical protein